MSGVTRRCDAASRSGQFETDITAWLVGHAYEMAQEATYICTCGGRAVDGGVIEMAERRSRVARMRRGNSSASCSSMASRDARGCAVRCADLRRVAVSVPAERCDAMVRKKRAHKFWRL